MWEWINAHALELLAIYLLHQIKGHLGTLVQRRGAWDAILEGIGDNKGLSLWDINQVRGKLGLERIELSKKE